MESPSHSSIDITSHMLSGVFGQNTSAPKTGEFLDDILRYYSQGVKDSMYYSVLIYRGWGPTST